MTDSNIDLKLHENIKKEFRAQIDGQDYIISLERTEYDDYIILEIKSKLNDYSIKFNQQEISSIIKEFKFVNNINEIYNTLSNIFTNQQFNIQEYKYNLRFMLKIYVTDGKEEEYNLILNPKTITKEEMIEKINILKIK